MPSPMADTFYITTAIDYVNGLPHLGHAYEKVLTDTITRYQRMLGRKAFMLTGTDEHGMKVQQSAQKLGRQPIEFCDEMSGNFKSLCAKLNVSNDDFIRTTEPRHKEVVRKILADLYAKGDIYKGVYEGYYSPRQEQFVTEKEMVDGKFPEIFGEVISLKEDVYYFRLAKYVPQLKEYLLAHPDFTYPPGKTKEVLGALDQKVNDLCISRPVSRLSWGIPLPFDEQQVTYVWFDALINYISAIGYGTERFKEFWPGINVIGKDILVPAHAIYWPCMLLAMGVELPKQIIVHGWWTQNQAKMSKSTGNAVNPLDLVNQYGVDAFRYFVLREMALGQDADFSREQFHQRYQSELANDLGNLLNRTVSMVKRYCGGVVPEIDAAVAQPVDSDLQKVVGTAISEYRRNMDGLQIHLALQHLWSGFQRANQYVEENAPWKLAKDPASKIRLDAVMANLVTVVARLSLELRPIIPATAENILSQLGLAGKTWTGEAPLAGTTVGEPVPLFPRIEVEGETAPAPAKKPKDKPSK